MMLSLPQPPCAPAEQAICYLHLVVPRCFQAAVERHHAHLLELAGLLGGAKLPPDEIAAHLDRVVESYRTQLLSAVDAYSKGHA
jgi:hypothetical protein